MEPIQNVRTNGEHRKSSKGASDWNYTAATSETLQGVKTPRTTKFRTTPAPTMRDAYSGDETYSTDSTSDTDGINAKPTPATSVKRHARISAPRPAPKQERGKSPPDSKVPKSAMPRAEKQREHREADKLSSLTSDDDLWESYGRQGGRYGPSSYPRYPYYGGGNLVPYSGYGYSNPYNPLNPGMPPPTQQSAYFGGPTGPTGFTYPTAGSHYPQPPTSMPPPPQASYNMGAYPGAYGYAPPQPWTNNTTPYQPTPLAAPNSGVPPQATPAPYAGAPPQATPAPAPAPGGRQPSTRKSRRASNQPTSDSDSEEERRLLRDDNLRFKAISMMGYEFRDARSEATQLVEDRARKERELEEEKKQHRALMMVQMERDLREKLMAEERAREEARLRDEKREAEMLARVREQVAREEEERRMRNDAEAVRVRLLREELRAEVTAEVRVQIQAEIQDEFADIRKEAEAARDRAKEVMDRVEAEAEAAGKKKTGKGIGASRSPSLASVSVDERAVPRRRTKGRKKPRARAPSPPHSSTESSTSGEPIRKSHKGSFIPRLDISSTSGGSTSSEDSERAPRRRNRHRRRRRDVSTTTDSTSSSSDTETDYENRLEGLAERVARKISRRLGGQPPPRVPPPPGFRPGGFRPPGYGPRVPMGGAPPPPPPGFERYAEPGSWQKYQRQNVWGGSEASEPGPVPVPVPVPVNPTQPADTEGTGSAKDPEPEVVDARRQSLYQENLSKAVILRPTSRAAAARDHEAVTNDVGVQELGAESPPASASEVGAGQEEASLQQPNAVEEEVTGPSDATRARKDSIGLADRQLDTQVTEEVSVETDDDWHVAPEAKDIGPEVLGKTGAEGDVEGKGTALHPEQRGYCIVQ